MKKKILRILAIDDDNSCRLSAARYLTLVGGHMVEVAGTGKEGLNKAAQLKPDIILLDMRVPDMSGLEVMDALSTSPSTCDIPVIIVTGAVLDDTEQANMKAKRNFLMLEEKPANFERLMKTIEGAIVPGIPDKTSMENHFKEPSGNGVTGDTA